MVGAIFFILAMSMMSMYMPALLVFQAERPILLRESASKMYGLCPYFVTRIGAEMPLTIISPLLFLALTYFAIGFQTTVSNFFKFYMILELLAQAVTGLAYMMSACFDSEIAALTFGQFLVMPMMLFGGLFVNPATTPVWLAWLQWLSPIFYSFNALTQVQWDGNTDCQNMIPPRPTCDYIPKYLGLNIPFWHCVYILIGITIIARILSLMTMSLAIRKF